MFHNSILGSKLCLGVKPAKDPGADGTEFRAPCDSVGSPTWGYGGRLIRLWSCVSQNKAIITVCANVQKRPVEVPQQIQCVGKEQFKIK